jgi:hypothetical protein
LRNQHYASAARGTPFAFALSCKIPARIAKESSGYAGR